MQLNLRINTELPTTPNLLSPEDGAANQPLAPIFDWDDLPLVSRYNFELATSPLFEAPLDATYGLTASSYTLADPLEGGKCYWWRAQAENSCGSGAWAEPFHFATTLLETIFVDDIESGADNWTHFAQTGVDHWVISTAQSHSPTHAWYVPDDAGVTDTRLWTTEPVMVGGGSELTFWHRYQFEGDNYDGAVLEISSDAGESWDDLGAYITANGYNGTISTSYSNPLSGREGWTGDMTTWTKTTVDLSSFAGQEVIIRWRLGCDTSVSDIGWYIDDVMITAPTPPNPAPSLLSITPSSGSNEVPIPVVISGSGFLADPVVQLGETWLISVTLVSSTTIEAVIPAGLPLGVYDLSLINGDCQPAALEAAFEVLPPVPVYNLIFLPVTFK